MTTTSDVRHRDVPLVIGYGGGVNSISMLIGMKIEKIRPDLISFADTGGSMTKLGFGGEKPETYSYMDGPLREWLKKNGFPDLTNIFTVCPEAGHRSLEEQCLNNETLPSRAFGYSSCAQRWKIEPQEKFLNHWQPAKTA